MARTLFILNDAPYGSERTYNGLRLAGALARRSDEGVRLFLLGDAVGCAARGQKVPRGYYCAERMVGAVARAGGRVAACGTCMDARGMHDDDLAESARRGTLEELAEWTEWAERVLVF